MKTPQDHSRTVDLAGHLVAVINEAAVSAHLGSTSDGRWVTAHLPYIGEVRLSTGWTDDMAGFHLTEVCGLPSDRYQAVYVAPGKPLDMRDVALRILPILRQEAKKVLEDSATQKPVANPALVDALAELRSAAEQYTGAEAQELSEIADGIETECADQLTIPAAMSEGDVLALIQEVAAAVGTEHGQLTILTAVVNTAIHRHRA
ncbi:hypothetical protein LG293_16530 (plasmid) [Citricoccus nitrophenolicus]